MIDWIEKFPDWMVGAFAAGCVWFGFNYVVLAERAMEKEHAQAIVPACIALLENDEHRQRSRAAELDAIGKMLLVPGLDDLPRKIIEKAIPRFLNPLEKRDFCLCSAREAVKGIRFDYAMHTASFRIIAPQSITGLRDKTVKLMASGVCGRIPQMKGFH